MSILTLRRHTRRHVECLNRDEVDAILQAPDTQTWAGRRDRTLLLVAVQTGIAGIRTH